MEKGFTAIITPTRGMLFSRVAEAIERERQGHNMRLYISSDLPIPDGHNKLTLQALNDGAENVIYIEEDVVPIAGTFDKLLASHWDIACIDYGVSAWSCVTKTPKGKILWCGLGCTLVNKRVFEALQYPYFRTDKVLRLNDWTWQDTPKDKAYGGLDIWFFCQAREKGFEIHQIEGECDHLKLEKLGTIENNMGLHSIGLKNRINNIQIISPIERW